jgi:hypothetical protein
VMTGSRPRVSKLIVFFLDIKALPVR